ncbi:MAG: hypothetical protein SAK29_33155 [Scytonema sp. PMC 1069.18]|nr:hypothetical protein [Scytonema sp. PMC 1069.18]MEC4887291.1 hypothetical protein [Scytonema sp. PMC 1070.18]
MSNGSSTTSVGSVGGSFKSHTIRELSQAAGTDFSVLVQYLVIQILPTRRNYLTHYPSDRLKILTIYRLRSQIDKHHPLAGCLT